MASPVNDTYSAPSGATVYGGRFALPAWLQGQPLFKIVEVPNTIHAGSPAAPNDDPEDPACASNKRLRAYCGMALRFDNSEIFLPALGGHQDYSGNEVTSIVLAEDEPTWQLRKAASAVGDRTQDSAYYADGTPSSRHTYWTSHWSEKNRRVMLHRTPAAWGSGQTYNASNGFDPATNEWDPAGTWSDGIVAACRDDDDNVWGANANTFTLHKWTADSDTWSVTGTFAVPVYKPLCYDSKREHLFSLAWGDGIGFGTQQVHAAIFTDGGTQRQAITFVANAAYEQFVADQPIYAAMEYDPNLDAYLFWEVATGRTNRIYVITPNSGTEWTMEILELVEGSAVLPAAGPGGICSKARYVPNLKGWAILPSGIHNIHFMRTG